MTTADWFIDKRFKILKPLRVYGAVDKGTGEGRFYYRTLKAGEVIVIYTYLDRTNANGSVWFGIYDAISQKTYFFKYEPNSLKHLKNYSGDSNTTDNEDHFYNDFIKNGKLTDGLFDSVIKPIAKYGLIALLGTVVIKQGFNYLSSSKKD